VYSSFLSLNQAQTEAALVDAKGTQDADIA
jgi:hypothetical protein